MNALVYIVDDDDSIRQALTRLIRSAGYQVISYPSADEFLKEKHNDSPSCLILDIRMPGLTGMDLQDALISSGHTLPIVFISGHADVPTSVKAMKRGAIDLLQKPFTDDELLTVIENAIDKSIHASKVAKEIREVENRLNTLTAREKEVFYLVVGGMPNKQIGGQLGISEKTIKVHRSRVMEKMKANSLAELVHLSEKMNIE